MFRHGSGLKYYKNEKKSLQLTEFLDVTAANISMGLKWINFKMLLQLRSNKVTVLWKLDAIEYCQKKLSPANC